MKFIIQFTVLFCFVFVNTSNAEDKMKWQLEDDFIFHEKFLNLSYNHAFFINTSQESPDGISHFEKYNEICFSYNSITDLNQFIGFGLLFEIYQFTDDYMKLINSNDSKNLYSIGFNFNYKFKVIKSKLLFLTLDNDFAIKYLFGENLKMQNQNGFDFTNYGLNLSTGPSFGFSLSNEFDLNFCLNIAFSYFGQLLFYPKINVSLSKWIN